MHNKVIPECGACKSFVHIYYLYEFLIFDAGFHNLLTNSSILLFLILSEHLI